MFRSTNNSGLRCALITLLLTVVCATSSFSQSTGILRGIVTGPDGEGVPGVKIVSRDNSDQSEPLRPKPMKKVSTA